MVRNCSPDIAGEGGGRGEGGREGGREGGGEGGRGGGGREGGGRGEGGRGEGGWVVKLYYMQDDAILYSKMFYLYCLVLEQVVVGKSRHNY